MDRLAEVGPLLALDISVDYPNRPDVLRDVRFTLDRGEVAGLIGPSGAGKSTLALAILRLLQLRGGLVRGRIWFDGRDLMRLSPAELRRVRGREIALVPQSPIAALNPALKLETQFREVWQAHSPDAWRDARDRVSALLASMGLPDGAGFLRRYPRQLSVGQAQRVTIAMAVMHRPKLLIADEPTSALDPSSRSGILDLFQSLNRNLGLSILYISHDLASVDRLCRRVIDLSPVTGNWSEAEAVLAGVAAWPALSGQDKKDLR
jgi:ABC-type glutathione transport system ATPase component